MGSAVTAPNKRVPQIVLGGVMKDVAFEPIGPQQFSETDDATTRARQLRTMSETIVEATRAARANRHNQSVFFEDLDVVASTNYSLRHGLGRDKVYIVVVRWQPTISGNVANWELGTGSDSNTVVYRSNSTGKVTLEVF